MDLSEAREQLNHIDDELVALFNERMDVVAEVAAAKARETKSVSDKTREREILSRVTARVPDDRKAGTQLLFNTLFDISKAYQSRALSAESPLKGVIDQALANTPQVFPSQATVACQGIEGAYSQIATDKLFSLANIMYFDSFEAVFKAVEQGLCTFGVLPIENSTYGSVSAVYDLMKSNHFSIVRSVKVPIRHALLAQPGTNLKDVRVIVSHEQAIGQCSGFLSAHPDLEVIAVENTAQAARMVAEADRSDMAALSSLECAELYGLVALETDLQDSDANYTRFIVISRNLEIYPGSQKVSFMLSVPHKPGSLYEVLSRFAVQGINLTKLESRPLPGKNFEFMFYFDFDAEILDDKVVDLLCELDAMFDGFTFLGAYHEV